MKTCVVCILLITLTVPDTRQIEGLPNEITNHTISDMSIEYIRYVILPERHRQFLEDYTKAAAFLQVSPYCLGYELTQGEEEPNNFILRIEWTSTTNHLEGFRKSEDFPKFLACIRAYYSDIREMKHYKQSALVWKK